MNAGQWFCVVVAPVAFVMFYVISAFRHTRRELRTTQRDRDEWMEAAINAECSRLRSRHGDAEADLFRKHVRYLPDEECKAICGRQERMRQAKET